MLTTNQSVPGRDQRLEFGIFGNCGMRADLIGGWDDVLYMAWQPSACIYSCTYAQRKGRAGSHRRPRLGPSVTLVRSCSALLSACGCVQYIQGRKEGKYACKYVCTDDFCHYRRERRWGEAFLFWGVGCGIFSLLLLC